MRNALKPTLALLLAAAACAGGSRQGTTGSTSGGTTTGGTTGAPVGLAPGSACSANQACASGICGADGTGNCCASNCATGNSACGATGCDRTGACSYPAAGSSCGDLCTPSICDGAGACDAGRSLACGGNFACSPDGGCPDGGCLSSADCAPGFVCNAGACVMLQATGPCTEDDDCANGICGIQGTGQCCNTGCISGSPCGAQDCDDAGACAYPAAETACGTVPASCSDHTQQNPTTCNGMGACGMAPGTVDCAPFVCGPTACLSTCGGDSDCISGDFCDIPHATCCSGLFANGIIKVDSIAGDDSRPCCGLGIHLPCHTLTQAMKSIDAAQATNVTILPTINGGASGDWTPVDETYPIRLGWGAEVNAPGIFFPDPTGQAEVFQIVTYSASDPAGYASICGSATSPVSIGLTSTGQQSADLSGVEVEAGSTLYLSNASINGSAGRHTTAITVAAGASLVLGDDQANLFPGTVVIGNGLNSAASDGFDGIVCGSANGKGCTVSDAVLKGASSVVIQGQEDSDIVARDWASISLTSAPVVGVAPADAGFGECPAKPDVDGMGLGSGQAVLLDGLASMTFGNGTVQCLSGTGFLLEASGNGTPTLTLENTLIQNTERALYATAGMATVSGSTIQFNYDGVEQGSDQTHVASIDLNGGADGGMNTVVCSSKRESVDAFATSPGVCVLNLSTEPIDASNVNWDTAGPDLFLCMGLSACTCEISGCTDTPGQDGMDAVYESIGTITTTGNGLSAIKCGAP